MMILRHLLSVLLLPFVVVVVVPRWLMSRLDSPLLHGGAAMTTSMQIAGAILFAAGFALFAWCVSLFARVGKGTLAPWDPTQRLVAQGPYRYVRNPMISGVVAMLAGETLFHNSLRVAEWFVTFLIINQTYFILLEEPGLERRFGEEYKRYKAKVPRWIPRRPRE